MKLGISSWTYTWAIGVNEYAPPRPLTPLDLVDKAGLGVQVIQVADNLPLHSLSVAQRRALALAAAQQGIGRGGKGHHPKCAALHRHCRAGARLLASSSTVQAYAGAGWL